MVKVTRTGLRLARSAAVAGNAAATGTWPAWENEFINPSRIGLVTGQAVDAALAHPKFTASASAEPQVAADARHQPARW